LRVGVVNKNTFEKLSYILFSCIFYQLLAMQPQVAAEAVGTLPPPEEKIPEGHVRMEAPPEESTCEAEIYALDACLHGQAKIANFINGIAGGRVATDLAKQGWGQPPIAYEDNEEAIDLAKTNIYRQNLAAGPY